MDDIDRLLREYIAEHKSGGEADPVAYLEKVEAGDRRKLAVLIEGYLERSPGRAWDPEAYKGSGAERLVEGLEGSLTGEAGLWPSLLPRLRNRARIKRADLVDQLAKKLGLESKREKVGSYYHQMEQGQLPSEGVADRVLIALGDLVGETAEALRAAGEAWGGTARGQPTQGVFARTAQQNVMYDAPAPGRLSPGTPEPEEWDEVDELFRGSG
jgi:hypothetical protein